jgi:hypothetical protein
MKKEKGFNHIQIGKAGGKQHIGTGALIGLKPFDCVIQIIAAMQQNLRGELTPHVETDKLFKTFAGLPVRL